MSGSDRIFASLARIAPRPVRSHSTRPGAQPINSRVVERRAHPETRRRKGQARVPPRQLLRPARPAIPNIPRSGKLNPKQKGGTPRQFIPKNQATPRLGKPHVPVVVIGYSRGGRIAVDYAAVRAARGQEPAAVLAVFPGLVSPYERLGPLEKLDARLKLDIIISRALKSGVEIGTEMTGNAGAWDFTAAGRPGTRPATHIQAQTGSANIR